MPLNPRLHVVEPGETIATAEIVKEKPDRREQVQKGLALIGTGAAVFGATQFVPELASVVVDNAPAILLTVSGAAAAVAAWPEEHVTLRVHDHTILDIHKPSRRNALAVLGFGVVATIGTYMVTGGDNPSSVETITPTISSASQTGTPAITPGSVVAVSPAAGAGETEPCPIVLDPLLGVPTEKKSVMEMQSFLNATNKPDAKDVAVDGIYKPYDPGSETTLGVMAFEESLGLPRTGQFTDGLCLQVNNLASTDNAHPITKFLLEHPVSS